MKKPTIFVLSGPAGAGKTTLVEKLFHGKSIRRSLLRSISFTTRGIRPKEREGKDYFFVDKKEFLKLKKKDFFLESQKVLDDYYGTPKYFYTRAKRENKDLVLCIDVKGTMYLKRKHKQYRIVTIFISAPTQKDLYLRLGKRLENKSVIKKRIRLAKKELKFSNHYDYLIINQSIKNTLKELEKILL